ncbi:Two-component response regulator ARR1-like protein [Gossypium australe]|uniref:Two-component response regulator ARR1-like protein n=1 Tax=Gossypium australe TaxID=47621 RepID=A0A5B6UT84_9ROSI|nr:Two-component response regulator ARR1-like protein [Gossypium australe]
MELSLDLSLVYVPKTISEFLKEVSKIKNGFQRLSKITDYLQRLEDEMKKIDAFKRELPLCMLLLKDGIERLKEEEIQCKEMNDGSVTEENGRETMDNDGGDKKNWMSSVQLWNSNFNNVDPHNKPNTVPELKLTSEEGEDGSESENPIEICNKQRKGGAFVPFKEQADKKVSGFSLMTPSSELASCILKNNGGCRIGSGSSLCAQQNQIKFQTKTQIRHEEQPQQQNSRKQRRCWSPELHRRFVEALQQLGGSQVATPKQIRELMQVDGLTNDEVKSHLQKYRLHIRKLPASSSGQGNELCSAQNQCNVKMKASMSQSGSPQGPLLGSASAKDMSSTGGDSMDTEDEKSDGHSWRSGIKKPGEVDV